MRRFQTNTLINRGVQSNASMPRRVHPFHIHPSPTIGSKYFSNRQHLQFEFQFEIEACRLDSPTSICADTIVAIRRIRTSSFRGARVHFFFLSSPYFFSSFLTLIMFHQTDTSRLWGLVFWHERFLARPSQWQRA